MYSPGILGPRQSVKVYKQMKACPKIVVSLLRPFRFECDCGIVAFTEHLHLKSAVSLLYNKATKSDVQTKSSILDCKAASKLKMFHLATIDLPFHHPALSPSRARCNST